MLFSVRDYWTYPGDRYALVNGWWQGHKGVSLGDFPENMVPPMALLVECDAEPVAFMACYQAVGIGVGIMDLICTKPGLSFAQSRGALLFGARTILEALKEHDYGICIGYGIPGASRVFTRAGWQDHGLKQHLVALT